MTHPRKSQGGIAIVGMACWYPGAQSTRQFWENILALRQQFRRLPDERLPLSDYFDPNRATPDKTYATEAAVLDGFQFDWKSRRVPKSVVDSTDITHWLALEVALKAHEDSKLDLTRLQEQQTGVIVGNTLNGEWTRTNAMRMRWPFVERVLKESAVRQGLGGSEMAEFMTSVEHAFKSVFPAVTEDTLAGALSNTIAGRICNVLDLHGGGYTVDGACSSSLLAVITAARNLANHELDVAFAGGIDISLDTFELIGFAKVGALTDSDMRVYDKRANGFIPGEGCGFVVMKRLEDAVRDGDRIYSVIKGWGISSDGKGGLTAPAVHGQAQAIGKAYAMAGYGIKDVSFIEGHGTGTTLGDKVEISALNEVLGDGVPDSTIGLTSLKSIVGHTKAAAGIGGLIKAAIAVNQRVVPPSAGVDQPNDLFNNIAKHFKPEQTGRVLAETAVIRAGVSAMGFGGINSHVTLESYGRPAKHLRPTESEDRLMASSDSVEVLVFASHSQESLVQELVRSRAIVQNLSRAELVDYASHLGRSINSQHGYRAVIVCRKPSQAETAFSKLSDWLSQPLKQSDCKEYSDREIFVAVARISKEVRIGFAFPGQGAHQLGMARKLVRRYDWAKDMVRKLKEIENVPTEVVQYFNGESNAADFESMRNTEIAQPAISIANAIWHEALSRFGVEPNVVIGHSLGELSALYAAGSMDFTTLVQLSADRGRAMAASGSQKGAMVSLACDQATAGELLQTISGYLTIANYNSSGQTVVSGDALSIEALLVSAKAKKIAAKILPVSNAFHSELMRSAAKQFAISTAEAPLSAPEVSFIKGVDGKFWEKGDNIESFLENQILTPVNFVEATRTLVDAVDFVVEVGPGRILSRLIQADHPSVKIGTLESRPGDDYDLKVTLSRVFVAGCSPNWGELYRCRFHKPFQAAAEKTFIDSPTERPLQFAGEQTRLKSERPTKKVVPVEHVAISTPLTDAIADTQPAALVVAPSEGLVQVAPLVRSIIAELTGFDAESVQSDLRLLDDLHLDSIKIMDLFFRLSTAFGIDGELIPKENFANASVGEIIAFVEPLVSQKSVETAPIEASNVSQQVQVSQVPAVPRIAEMAKAKNRVPWVRMAQEVFVTQPAPQVSALVGGVAVLCDQSNVETAKQVVLELRKSGLEARECMIGSMIEEKQAIAMVPQNSSARDSVAFLTWVAGLTSLRWLSFVQQDDGNFGRSAALGVWGNAKAFAQSIAKERPHLAISALSYEQSLPISSLVTTMLKEGGESPVIAAYDADGQRRVPEIRYLDAAELEPRSLTLGADDVIVVTGGAKGITSLCALAMAKRFRTKMVLLGSSARHPEGSDDISGVLAQYESEGLIARYYQCDVTSAIDVDRVIQTVRSELGAIAGIVHGAGVNRPRPASTVTFEEAFKEIQPKALGLTHLVNACSSDELRIVIGFGSIIGVTGMPGNAWYGYSNEVLDRLLRQIKAARPNIDTLNVAYSVWSGVGMGDRLGSAEKLENIGIGSISVEQGVSRFMQLLAGKHSDQEVIVTSRLGNHGARNVDSLAKSVAYDFGADVRHAHDGVEIIARHRLDTKSHPYLLDHNYKGSYLFPTVFGLEAMMQIAQKLLPQHDFASFALENVALEKPIVVPESGVDIEICVEMLERTSAIEPRRAFAVIRTAMTGFREDHFSAEFVFESLPTAFVSGVPDGVANLGVDPKESLYGSILFQGELFQRLESLQHLESDNETEGRTRFQSRLMPQCEANNALGDPYFRDSLLQSAQIIIPQNQCLPVRIGRIEFFRGLASDVVKRHCFTDVRRVDDKTYRASVEVFTDDGRLIERMDGYELRFLSRRDELPTAMSLIPATQPEVAATAQLMPYRDMARQLVIDAEPNGPQGQAVFVHRFIPDFKTFANPSRSIYFSHIFNWMGWARELSSMPVLDEIRSMLETGEWGMVTNWAKIDVLGELRSKNRIVEARMWCGKIGGTSQSTGTLTFDWVSKGDDGIEERIATGQMQFTWVKIVGHGLVQAAPLPKSYSDFMVDMTAKTDDPDHFMRASEPYRDLCLGKSLYEAPRGPNSAIELAFKRFETSSYDSNLVGNLYFGNYSIWMGRLFDQWAHACSPELFVQSTNQGEFTCIKSEIRHLREAMPYDTIGVSMKLRSFFDNGVELEFEFFKDNEEQEREKLAVARHKLVWTMQAGAARRVAEPIPAEIRRALQETVRKQIRKVAS